MKHTYSDEEIEFLDRVKPLVDSFPWNQDRITAHARQVVADWPPLTDEQKTELRAVFAQPTGPGQERVEWVYFIGSEDGPIKIGVSTDPQQRLASLRSHNPADLKILKQVKPVDGGGYALERQFHKRFSHLRIRGEWFSPAPELMAYIEGGES